MWIYLIFSRHWLISVRSNSRCCLLCKLVNVVFPTFRLYMVGRGSWYLPLPHLGFIYSHTHSYNIASTMMARSHGAWRLTSALVLVRCTHTPLVMSKKAQFTIWRSALCTYGMDERVLLRKHSQCTKIVRRNSRAKFRKTWKRGAAVRTNFLSCMWFVDRGEGQGERGVCG